MFEISMENEGLRHRKDVSSQERPIPEVAEKGLVDYGKLEARRTVKLAIAGVVGCFAAMVLIDVGMAFQEGGTTLKGTAMGLVGDAILSLEAGVVAGVFYAATTTSLSMWALAGKIVTCCRPVCSRTTVHKCIVALSYVTTALPYAFFTGSVFGAFVSTKAAVALTIAAFAVGAKTYQYLNAPTSVDYRLPVR